MVHNMQLFHQYLCARVYNMCSKLHTLLDYFKLNVVLIFCTVNNINYVLNNFIFIFLRIISSLRIFKCQGKNCYLKKQITFINDFYLYKVENTINYISFIFVNFFSRNYYYFISCIFIFSYLIKTSMRTITITSKCFFFVLVCIDDLKKSTNIILNSKCAFSNRRKNDHGNDSHEEIELFYLIFC
ncbi:hypothetical protein AGLY_008572 [Aphis glycines]|uniref:Uncharacterized protein n=1 Tax=Aphis glycines TaxID=307491 RepID=A0A6G0TKG9_APHGL|nr:hypothetical protein AGLY_008572 [Aphis glycines]